MLVRYVKLEQAREGVGDIMRGKRRRARGKRRGEGGGRERTVKNRVIKEKEQPTFMEMWTSQVDPSASSSSKKTGVGDREGRVEEGPGAYGED